MSESSIADKLKSWTTLVEAMKPRLEDLAHLRDEQTELEAVVQEMEALGTQEGVHTARLRETVRRRREVERRGVELKGRLPSGATSASAAPPWWSSASGRWGPRPVRRTRNPRAGCRLRRLTSPERRGPAAALAVAGPPGFPPRPLRRPSCERLRAGLESKRGLALRSPTAYTYAP